MSLLWFSSNNSERLLELIASITPLRFCCFHTLVTLSSTCLATAKSPAMTANGMTQLPLAEQVGTLVCAL